MKDENRRKKGYEGDARKKGTDNRRIAKNFIKNDHNKSRNCTGISDRQRKARITGVKSQTFKGKAIITGVKSQTFKEKAIISLRGESQAGRKRQEDQSDRQNEKLLLQVEEVKQEEKKTIIT